MEYLWVNGFRNGSNLLYVSSQKMLYVLKVERNGSKQYICYQTILSASKKNADNNNQPCCTARVRILPDGTCEKMSLPHTTHDNHEQVMADMNKINKMKTQCQSLKDDHADDARRIPTRHIYQRVISK